ncbi:MAG: hypothetical protein WCI76_01775 [bacterium]
MNTKIINKESKSIFRKFSDEENAVWKILCEKRFKGFKDLAFPLHKKGWDLLEMSVDKIPDFADLNKKLKKLTGWQVASTGVQYEEDDAWLSSLSKKTIRVTEYIRERKNLDYTPLPDVFHDAFAHLPLLAIPEYAKIAHKFGLAYVKAKTKEDKKKIAENWWYGIEFGLIKEDGKLKAFGTGLISSESELINALSEKVEKIPHNWETIGEIDRSAHELHKKLFVLENMQQLENAVDHCLQKD